MRNKLALLTIFGILIVSSVFAQMDNLSNMSAKWVSSNTRNAATDEADIVNYNPAGVVRLSDGIHINLSNQTMFRKPEHTFDLGAGEQTYGQDGTDAFLPNLYLAYKKTNWSVASGVYISGGGATANYPRGSINTNLLGYQILAYLNPSTGAGYKLTDQFLKASSYYLTVPVQFAYSISDQLSFAVGGRYIRGINNTEAGITLGNSAVGAPNTSIGVDYKENATGFNGVFGVFYQPTKKLGISLHYESRAKLNFEATDNKGSYVITDDGTKNRRDLPAVLCTGASYRLTDKLTAAADFNYYFQKNANWGSINYGATNIDAAKAAGNCYTAGLGFSFQATKMLELNTGCKYTRFMYDNQVAYYSKMGLFEVVKYNNLNIGLGASYNLSKNLKIDLGGARTFWKDQEIYSNTAGTLVSVKDKGYVFAIGIDLTI